MRTVTYVSPNDNINDDNSKNSREFTFTIYNSNAGKTVTNQRSIVQSFTIQAVIDNPVLTMGKNVNTEFTEHGAGSFVDDSIIITDEDDVNLDSAVIRISANYDYIVNSPSTGNALNLGDSLFFASLPSGITASYTYGHNTGDSIRLSGTFGLKLSDDDYEKILPPQGESVGSAKEFNWYVETPDGNVVEIINNAGNKTLTTSLSQWSTEVGIYKF